MRRGAGACGPGPAARPAPRGAGAPGDGGVQLSGNFGHPQRSDRNGDVATVAGPSAAGEGAGGRPAEQELMNTLDEHPRGALHAYLDGELSLEGSLEVEHHLSECAACRRELETYRALRRLLQSAKATAPEAETALLRVTRNVRLRHRRRTFAVGGVMAMAAAALVTLVLIPGRTSGIVGEVAAVHERALEAGHSVEIASDDPAAVERWLSDRLPGAVPPTAGGDGFALRGARVD